MSDDPNPVSIAVGKVSVSATNPFPVTPVSGGVAQDVNLTKVGGAAIALGQTTMAASIPVALASNQSALATTAAQLPASLGQKAPNASLSTAPAGMQYETVAASQTAQVLGATGATGDYLSHVILQPVTTAAGTTTILDNATVIFTFTTGTLADLSPKTVPIGCYSVSGAWKITTGANITATGIGNFT